MFPPPPFPPPSSSPLDDQPAVLPAHLQSSNPFSGSSSIPPPIPAPPMSSNAPPPASSLPSWSGLFKQKPRNAGKFSPVPMNLTFSGEAMVPPEEVIQAGKEKWSEWVVGFFLDAPLSYLTVVQFLKFHWKLKGSIQVRFDGFLFMFNFSCLEDKNRILSADPIIIRNKVFIIQEWNPNIGSVCEKIPTVPVWIQLSSIPLLVWSHLGINWLASRVGKFLCMDENTERLERLSYAKCMVEVQPNQELVDSFPIKLLDGKEHVIKVSYLWKPDICVKCNSFGHKTAQCNNGLDPTENVQDKHGKQDEQQPNRMEHGKKEFLQRMQRKKVWHKVNNGKGKNFNSVRKLSKKSTESNDELRKSTTEKNSGGNKEVEDRNKKQDNLEFNQENQKGNQNGNTKTQGGTEITNFFNCLSNLVEDELEENELRQAIMEEVIQDDCLEIPDESLQHATIIEKNVNNASNEATTCNTNTSPSLNGLNQPAINSPMHNNYSSSSRKPITTNEKPTTPINKYAHLPAPPGYMEQSEEDETVRVDKLQPRQKDKKLKKQKSASLSAAMGTKPKKTKKKSLFDSDEPGSVSKSNIIPENGENRSPSTRRKANQTPQKLTFLC